MYLESGVYADLDWDATLDYMARRYIQPLRQHCDISRMHLADCAAGFGWFSYAYLLAGGLHATLIDSDFPRLQDARAIAAKLGLLERCSFVFATLESLPFKEDFFDIFASVETLEHVGKPNIAACVNSLVRCTRQCILLTTPNACFPVVAHDTRLPFAHWLPKPWRRVYAGYCGRLDMDEGSDFLSPADLAPLRAQFQPVARFQTFNSYPEFVHFYPHYLPYGPQQYRQRARPSLPLRCFVFTVGSVFGRQAYRFSPNLSNIWLRKA